MEKNIMDHLVAYPFQVGEVVTIGGNPNVLGEVVDISDSVQVGVRILTPPQAGNMVFTTRFTYYTTPMPHLTAKDIREKYLTAKKREIKLAEPVKTIEITQEDVLNKHEEITYEKQEVKLEKVITQQEVIEETLDETFIKEEETNYEFSEDTEVKQIQEVAADEDFMQLSLF